MLLVCIVFVYNYELLSAFFPDFLHSCIRQRLWMLEYVVEPKRHRKRFQFFREIWLLHQTIQVYLKKNFSSEHYPNTLDILIFNVCLFSIYFFLSGCVFLDNFTRS